MGWEYGTQYHRLSKKKKKEDEFNHLVYILIGTNSDLVVASTIHNLRFVRCIHDCRTARIVLCSNAGGDEEHWSGGIPKCSWSRKLPLQCYYIDCAGNQLKWGGEKWLGDNLNRAHLDYFYWVLAGMSAFSLCVYVWNARRFVYKKIEGDKVSKGQVLQQGFNGYVDVEF
jgi:hypothetical protein